MFLVRLIILIGSLVGFAYFGHISLAIKILGLAFLCYIVSLLYSVLSTPIFFILGLSKFKKIGSYIISAAIYGSMVYIIAQDFDLIKM